MKILICPLNWGLGHATRCVPIIRELIADGHEPVLVSDGFPLEFLRQEFPTLRYIKHPSYKIHYSSGMSQIAAMFLSLPSIFFGILREHWWLKKLLKKEHFDQVISDNRFGLWNRNIQSIYITHQLMVKMPIELKLLVPVVWYIHRMFIRQYNECWIPDREETDGLSGDLVHKYPLPDNAIFIGPQSRFQGMEIKEPNTDFEVVAMLSGIEPQRTLFEQSLIGKYRDLKYKTLIVSGQPTELKKVIQLGNVTLVSHLTDFGLASVLIGSKRIVSRSGYSTIMDLVALDCLQKAELIPTPGQTEQEYLAELHAKH